MSSSQKPEPLHVYTTLELLEACADFFFLLERGYNRKVALDLVTARWNLSKLERLALYRGVFDSATSKKRVAKILRSSPDRLTVDGFNVLSTISSALIGDTLLLATDGFVRDLAATIRKVEVSRGLISSLVLMLSFLSHLRVREVIIVFDAQVSRSGELVKIVNSLLPSYIQVGEAFTSKQADSSLLSLGKRYTLATSDSVLIDKTLSVFDLGGELCWQIRGEKIINLKQLVELKVRKLAKSITERDGTLNAQDGYENEGA
ncbi:MAG: DUF434 domain-containing protein [Thermofilaceae archaeon]|nr:DUF434 domain-containing protein [Thermofilaceae archaeon]MDW8003711.1 DUF434 domain-containing protein [Thermofilaceae archaeon]